MSKLYCGNCGYRITRAPRFQTWVCRVLSAITGRTREGF